MRILHSKLNVCGCLLCVTFPINSYVIVSKKKHIFVSDKCEVEDVAGGRPLQTRIITLINISRGAADVIIAAQQLRNFKLDLSHLISG